MENSQEISKPYRANRKKFFLTYARSGDLTKEEVLAHMESFGPVERYLIAQEAHQDGEPHIHAYIEFSKKQDFKNCRWADIKDRHPNDKGNPKSDYAVAKYCSKDGNFITNYWTQDPFAEAMAAETVDEGMAILRTKRPRESLIHGEAMERNLKRMKRQQRKPKFRLDQFSLPPLDMEKKKCYLLWGPSGTGKTQYALAQFKRPLLVRHVDRIRDLSPDHDGVVFDDLSFTHWPVESVIHMLDVDEDSDLNMRYVIGTLPEGLPRVFTHNTPNPFYLQETPVEQMNAVERRVERVHVPADIRNK